MHLVSSRYTRMTAPVYLLENKVTPRGDKRSSSHSRLMYSLPPVSVGPIYLSWDEQAPILPIEEHEVDSTIDSSRSARKVSFPRQLLPELPPSCNSGHMPEYDVTYTFSFPSSGSTGASMLVIPPSQWSTTSPIYKITVGQHPFLPTCQITSVFKGANDDGLYIGGFKTLISKTTNPMRLVCIRGRECKSENIFRKVSKKKGIKTFIWGNEQSGPLHKPLQWSCPKWPSAGSFTCYDQADEPCQLARFVVSDDFLHLNVPTTSPKLIITPIGRPLFDDILLSVLLLERHRLTAAFGLEVIKDNNS